MSTQGRGWRWQPPPPLHAQDTHGLPREAIACRPLQSSGLVRICPVGLRGGKGGFGASLRASGKSRGPTSFDFSACRDLNGRRLRAVNDSLRLAAWNTEEEAAKRKRLGERYSEPVGPNGLKQWHLPVPNWAGGLGAKKAKQLLHAAQRRGRIAEARKSAAEEEALQRKEDKARALEAYADSARPQQGEGGVLASIRAGMALRTKRQREAASRSTAQVPQHAPVVDGLWCRVLGAEDAVDVSYFSLDEERAAAGAAGGGEDEGVFGAAVQVPAVARVVAVEAFPTVGVPSHTVSSGAWAFEVTVAAGGVAQVGWMQPAALDGAGPHDGVGDVPASWAWDGSRGILFSQGAEQSGAPTWTVGDVVTCTLSFGDGRVAWRVNGEPVDMPLDATSLPPGSGPLMPAVSLEQGSAVQLNMGFSGLKHAVPGFQPATNASAAVVHLQLPASEPSTVAVTRSPRTLQPPAHAARPSPQAPAPSLPTADPAPEAATQGAPAEAPKPTAALTKLSEAELDAWAAGVDMHGLKLECLMWGLKCSGTRQQRVQRLRAARNAAEKADADLVPRKARAVDFAERFAAALAHCA